MAKKLKHYRVDFGFYSLDVHVKATDAKDAMRKAKAKLTPRKIAGAINKHCTYTEQIKD